MSELRQRRPRVHCEAYLEHIRSMRCLICSGIDVEAAHIRTGSIDASHRGAGGAEKSDDRWALPLCNRHHTEQHSMNELAFWKRYRLDPYAIAMRLWSAWQKATGWVQRQPSKSQKPRMQKPRPSAKPTRAKSKWPRRPMMSRNTFADGRQGR